MTNLSKWAEENFDVMLAEVETSHGSAMFDKWSHLDPTRAARQMTSALGLTVTPAMLNDARALVLGVEGALSSGGTPGWVPANAKIFIDLVNNRAWTEADGVVAVDTLLGADANSDNGWDTTVYDPALLTADGYYINVGGYATVAWIGSARTKILAGATVTMRCKQVLSDTTPDANLILLSADGANGVYAELTSGGLTLSSYGSTQANFADDIPNAIVAGAINVIAVTFDGTRMDVAVNGRAARSETWQPSEIGGLAVTMFSVGGAAIQTITIYDPLPDTTGLSALSQTGVTNTAPTSISINWQGNAPDGVWTQGGDNTSEIARPVVVDPEGNPCTLTVAAQDQWGSGFDIINLADPNFMHITNSSPDPGTYHFTLRATDPGGLYVEQTFTITVTA